MKHKRETLLKKVISFLLIFAMALQGFGIQGIPIVHADEINMNELHISGTMSYQDSGYERFRPAFQTVKDNIKFIVKKDGEVVDSSLVEVKQFTQSGADYKYEIVVADFDKDSTYSVASVLPVDTLEYDYTFSEAGLATTPKIIEDVCVFYADAAKINIKPVVTSTFDKTFNISWWDGNDADKMRPDKDDFLDGCELEYSLDGEHWSVFGEDEIKKYKLANYSNSISDKWAVSFKGIPKEVVNEEGTLVSVNYRLKTPDDIDQYRKSETVEYRYEYCADLTGSIIWNNNAVDADNLPDENDIALEIYYVDANGDYQKIVEDDDHKDYFKNNTSIDTDDPQLWTYAISKLPTYDDKSNRIVYVVKQVIAANQDGDAVINGYTYTTEYDNKSISTATDACYGKGYIINTVADKVDLSFNVEWVEPEVPASRPDTLYTLWRYAKGKTVPGTTDTYDYSTAAMVTYIDGDTRKTVMADTSSWTVDQDKYVVTFKSNDDYELPKYDEEGYEYVYFLKQTNSNMTTDIEGYDEYFFKEDGTENAKEERIAYENGTIRNVYQEPVLLDLRKKWSEVKDVADLEGTSVILVITRAVDGVVDADYSEEITLAGFSAQFNEKKAAFYEDRYDSNGKEYEYIVEEKVVKGGTVYFDGTTADSDEYYINSHIYSSTVTMKDDTVNAKGEITREYDIINKEETECGINIVKNWGSTYADVDFADLPDTITTHIKQNDGEYAKVVFTKPATVSEKGTAVISRNGKDDIVCEFSVSADGKKWTLNSKDVFTVPFFDENEHEYVYTITENAVAPPVANGHSYYHTNYSRTQETVDGIVRDVLTNTITNNYYIDGEYFYKTAWVYKNWKDDGDSTLRSAIDIHCVILGADGLIAYDLTDDSDRADFVDKVKTEYTAAYTGNVTDEEYTKYIKVLEDTILGTSASFETRVSAGTDWKVSFNIPKDMEEYASYAGGSFYMVEAAMYTTDGKTLLTDAAYKGYNYGSASTDEKVIHNDKICYVEEIEKKSDSHFVFTNTRKASIDVTSTFKWNDFDDFVETRPKNVSVTLFRYTDKNSTPVKVENTVELDVGVAGQDYFTYTFNDEDEYDEDGSVYHYVVELSYTDKNDNVVTELVPYDISSSSEYEKGYYDTASSSMVNSKVTYNYVYELSDEVDVRNVSYYKIWRDEAKKLTRPDLALKLYKDVETKTVDGNSITTEKAYCGYVDSKCEILDGFALKYTFFDMPSYKVIRDENGVVTGVEKYEYFSKEVINTSLDIYYSYQYEPAVSVMDDSVAAAVTTGGSSFSYDDINDWSTYAAGKYADDYQDRAISGYLEEGGCFVNGIKENLEYTGTKTWTNLPDNVSKDDYPYIEVYFFQNKTAAQIEALKAGGVTALRNAATAYTNLNDSKDVLVGTNGSPDKITVPKYDECGRAYKYTITECIFMGNKGAGSDDLEFAPDFIMTSKNNGTGTQIYLKNTYDPEGKNKRNLVIDKKWFKDGVALSSNTEAKFALYRVEKDENYSEITTAAEFNSSNATFLKNVYVKNNGGSGSVTIEDMPVYSPKGYEYEYIAVEITDYAPAFTNVSATQTDSSAVVLTSTDFRYVKFGSVGSFSDGKPQEVTTSPTSTVSYQNDEITDKAIIKGTVTFKDTDDLYGSRPDEKLVFIQITKSSDTQSDAGHSTGNNNSESAVFDVMKAVLIEDTTDASYESGKYDAVYKIPADAEGNTLNQDVYIKWEQNFTDGKSNNTWTYTITGANGAAIFDEYSDTGKAWKYYATEKKTEGADYQYFADNYIGYGVKKTSSVSDHVYTAAEIVNTLYSEVTIQKQWSDTKDQYRFRPVSINISFQYKLKDSTEWITYTENGTDEFILKDDTGSKWSRVFKNLPKQTSDGKEYEYRVIENAVNINIEDTLQNVPVKYYDENGDLVSPTDDMKKGTLSSKHETISGEYYVGKAGSYTAKVPYTIDVESTASIFIYNNLEKDDTVKLPITKKWEGDSTYSSIVRPKTIYVKIQKLVSDKVGSDLETELANNNLWNDVLLTDGSSPLILTLTDKDALSTDSSTWTKEYEQLPKFDAVTGNECYYRAVETDSEGNELSYFGSYKVSSEYTLSSETTTDTPYSSVITNTYVKNNSFTLKKLWDDDDNRDGLRPDTIKATIQYYNPDTQKWVKFTDVTLGKDNNGKYKWSETFTDLPLYYISEMTTSPTLMKYKVVETKVTSYTDSYAVGTTATSEFTASDSTAVTLDITNKYTPCKGNLILSKLWSGDTSVSDVSRPSSISVRIYRTYTENGVTKYEYYDSAATTPGFATAVTKKIADTDTTSYITTIGADDNWEIKLSDLPLNTNKAFVGTSDAAYVPGTSLQYTYCMEEITTLNGYKVAGKTVTMNLANGKDNTLSLQNYLNEVHVSLDFTWEDLTNALNTRKDYVLVLEREDVDNSGNVTWKSVDTKDVSTAEDDNGDTYTFATQPMYDASNTKYQYRTVLKYKNDSTDTGLVVSTGNTNTQKGAYEITSKEFTSTDSTGTSGQAIKSYVGSVKAVLPVVNVTGQITWSDQDDYFGVRPAANAYEITLKQPGTNADTTFSKTVKCTATTGNSNSYTYNFTNLRKYDDNGTPISYTTSEVVDSNYTASSTEPADSVKGTGTNSYAVKNHTTSTDGSTYTMTTIHNELNVGKITVKKALTAGNPDDEFQFTLYIKSGDNWVAYKTTSAKIKNGGSVTFENLLEGSEYKIVETDAGRYNASVTASAVTPSANFVSFDSTNKAAIVKLNSDISLTFTNTGIPSKEVDVTKLWANESNYVSISTRPTDIYVILKRTADGSNWETVSSNGNPVVWTIGESNTSTVVSEDNSTWKLTISDLPGYDANNNAYTYKAFESDSSGKVIDKTANYTVGLDDGNVITNTYQLGNLKVDTEWDDDSNRDGIRPKETSISLMYYDEDTWKTYTGTYKTELTQNWTYTFSDLPVYDKSGNEIKYKVTQGKVNYYNTTYSYTDNVTLTVGETAKITITDTHTNYVAPLTVTKKWAGDASDDSARPSSVEVIIYRTVEGKNTTEYYKGSGAWTTTKNDALKIALGTNNSWTKTFAGHDENMYVNGYTSDGTTYKYTYHVTEITSLSGYSVSTETCSLNATANEIKVTNTLNALDVKVNFTWDDYKNELYTRVQYEVVIQRRTENGNWENVASKNIDKDNETSDYEFKDLARFTSDNEEYEYQAVIRRTDDTSDTQIVISSERKTQYGAYSIEGKNPAITDPTTENGNRKTIGFVTKAVLPVVTVTGEITWSDQDNYFKVRPKAGDYNVTLKQTGDYADDDFEKTAACTVAEEKDNSYTYVFEKLQKYDANGKEIEYTTSEVINKNYTASSKESADSVKGTGTNSYAVKNHTTSTDGSTYTMTTIHNELNTYSVTLQKALNRGDPDTKFNFDVYFYIAGEWVKTDASPLTLKAGESTDIENILAGTKVKIVEADEENLYTVDIIATNPVSGEVVTVDSLEKTGIITVSQNTLVTFTNEGKEKIPITVSKDWARENEYGSISKRPENIYFILQRTVYEGTEGNVWKNVTGDDGNVKVWTMNAANCSDSEHPEKWKYTVEDLQAFSFNDNKRFVYRVVETDAKGNELGKIGNYQISYSYDDDTYANGNNTITNSYIYNAPLTIRTEWDDEDNRDGIRPADVEFILSYYDADVDDWVEYKDAEGNPVKFVIGKDDDWKMTFDSLPVYDKDGKEINYKVTQGDVDKYTTDYEPEQVEISLTEEKELVIINHHRPCKKSLTVEKYWRGDELVAEETRPDSISVILYRNYTDAEGDVITEYLSGEGAWSRDKTQAFVTQMTGEVTDDVWTYTFDGDKNNLYVNAYTADETVPYTYWIEEIDFDGYSVVKSETVAKDHTTLVETDPKAALVNELDTIDVKADVVFHDYGNELDTRREVLFTLQRFVNGQWEDVINPETGEVWSVNADDDWKAEFLRLPTHDKDGNEISYRTVISAFGGNVEMVEISDTEGLKGFAQTGKVSAYAVDAQTELVTEDGMYYHTSFICTLKYQLGISNVTENPADDTKTDVGGKVEVLDDLIIDDFDIDDIPDPSESDETGYKRGKTGVVFEADEFWTINDVIIIYYEENGKTVSLELSVKDLLDGIVPENVKDVFPSIALFEKEDKYVLVLSDNVLDLPEKINVNVSFVPSYGMINLTEDHKGGTVENIGGTAGTISDGIAAYDGHNGYETSEFIAKACEGYKINIENLKLAWLGDYENLSDDQYTLTIGKDNTFTITVKALLNGELLEVTVNGTVAFEYDENGNVISMTINSDSKLPLVFGVYFEEIINEEPEAPTNPDDEDATSGNKPENSENPGTDVGTGDSTIPVMWLLVVILAAGCTSFGFKRKKEEN